MTNWKKWMARSLCVIVLALGLALPAAADVGPKPSVEVALRGLEGRRYYVTLLADREGSGPWSAENDYSDWMGDKAAWEIRVDPGLDAVGIYPAHSNLYYCPSKKILTQMKGLAGGCLLEISLKGDILDLCVNGERTLICRLQKGYADGESVSWSGFVKDGKVLFA